MANLKVTELGALTVPAAADLIHVIDDVAGTPVNKKTVISDLIVDYITISEEDDVSVVPSDFRYPPGDSRRYGTVGNGDGVGGGTDDSTALANWLKVVGEGVLGFLSPDIYRMDTPLLLTDKTANIFAYGATLDFSNNSTAAAVALKITGSESATTTTLTANALQGATALTVASETGFAADDWFSLESDTELLGTTATFVKGELQQIESVSANTLTLYSGLKTSYDQGTPTVTITKFNMIEAPEVHGLTVIGSGTIADDHIGIVIGYAVNPLLERTRTIDCSSAGQDFNRCDHGVMESPYSENNNDNVGATGYSFSMSPLCQFCTINNPQAKRFKHFFTTGGLLPVWNFTILGGNGSNQIKSFSTFAIDTHANGVNGLIVGTTINYAYGGIRFRGPRCKMSDCVATNIYAIQCFELALDGPVDGEISNCRGEGLFGIKVTDDTGATDFSTSLLGNNLYARAINGGTIGTGIISNGPNCLMQGGSVNGFSPGITNSGDNATIDVDIYDTIATGNAYGLQMLDGDDCFINGCKIACPNSTTMTRAILLGSAATRTRIIGNDLSDYTNQAIDDSGTDTIIGQNFLDGVQQPMIIPETVTTTNVITAAENGRTFHLNLAGGFTSTLPAPSDGLKFKFIVKTAPTTAYIITTAVSANVLFGTFLDIVGELTYFSAQDTLNFVASTSVVGDSLEVEGDGTNWICKAISGADGGITVAVT